MGLDESIFGEILPYPEPDASTFSALKIFKNCAFRSAGARNEIKGSQQHFSSLCAAVVGYRRSTGSRRIGEYR
jgi:hypothetical protein